MATFDVGVLQVAHKPRSGSDVLLLAQWTNDVAVQDTILFCFHSLSESDLIFSFPWVARTRRTKVLRVTYHGTNARIG